MTRGMPLVAGVLGVGLLLAGCDGDVAGTRTSFDARHSDFTVAEAAQVDATPLFWLGPRFEGLPLITISGDARFGATFIYGDCSIPDGQDDGGCSPPLQVQTVKMCRSRTPTTPLRNQRTLRGVPAGTRGGGIVLLSRQVEVRVFADSTGRGIRAARAVRAINDTAPGAVAVGEPLPSPPARAAERLPCSVTSG